VQLYESSPEAVKSEIGTFFEAFPNGIIWGNTHQGKGYDTVLMGQVEPSHFNVDELQAKMDRPEYAAVKRSLGEIGIGSAIDLLANYAGRAADRLWNTGVFVAPVAALLDLGRRRLTRLSDRLAQIAPFIDTPEEPWAIQPACTVSSPTNLSRDVFMGCAANLAASRLPAALLWSDWTTPERVIQTLREVRVTPAWLDALTRGGVRRGSAARHHARFGRRPSSAPGRRP
jgi:hypothetical protein